MRDDASEPVPLPDADLRRRRQTRQQHTTARRDVRLAVTIFVGERRRVLVGVDRDAVANGAQQSLVAATSSRRQPKRRTRSVDRAHQTSSDVYDGIESEKSQVPATVAAALIDSDADNDDNDAPGNSLSGEPPRRTRINRESADDEDEDEGTRTHRACVRGKRRRVRAAAANATGRRQTERSGVDPRARSA